MKAETFFHERFRKQYLPTEWRMTELFSMLLTLFSTFLFPSPSGTIRNIQPFSKGQINGWIVEVSEKYLQRGFPFKVYFFSISGIFCSGNEEKLRDGAKKWEDDKKFQLWIFLLFQNFLSKHFTEITENKKNVPLFLFRTRILWAQNTFIHSLSE